MWILISIGIAVIVILLGLFVIRKEKTKINPINKGMALGGIVGMLIGISLVEFWGYGYPVPFILWMFGMAGGQLIGWFYNKKK